jgi:hypothetical protein
VNRHLASLRIGLAAFGIIFFASTIQAQNAISIHWVNDGNGAGGPGLIGQFMDATEVAGVVPKANWNQADGPFGYNQPLNDQNGVALSAGFVSWEGSNTWSTQAPDAPGDARMMGSYLDSNNTRTNFVAITGISGSITGAYDLYIYSNGDGHGGRHGFYTVITSGGNDAPLGGMLTQSCTDTAVYNTAKGYIQDMQDGNGGNYIKFTGLSGDGLVILASAYDPIAQSNAGFRAPINGIQIVSH